MANQDFSVTLKFGGGVHSRASEDEIDVRECSTGQNFDLDLQNREYKNRKPFDLIGQVPNASEIRGMACLSKSDGTVSALVQAGDTVYEWDGTTNFTSVGSVSSTAKLRGRLEHNWQLDDIVIITDLNLQQPVMSWDGTTLQNITFTTEDGSTAFGTFKSRYCFVSNERAVYSNIHDNGTDFPHLIIGSERGSYTIISVAQRPSSSLSAADAFFLIQPDYRYINGVVEAYGQIVTSSKEGSLFTINGSDATDFSISELYPRSGASGDESVVYVGNDVIYGRQGRIESVVATQNYGDVETDDLSSGIYNLIEDYSNWTNVYNSRNQRIYCIPSGESEMWVLHKSLVGSEISPWSKWTTNHSIAFSPTCIMNMLDPSDGLEYVFMGDSNGNFYRMEGSGTSGDGGTNNITSERLSKLFQLPLDAEAYDVEGYILYRKADAATAVIRMEWSGYSVTNESMTINIPAITSRTVYGGGFYYSDGNYYGTAFQNRLTRQLFTPPGKSTEFQLRVTIEGTTDFAINAIGLKFKGVPSTL